MPPFLEGPSKKGLSSVAKGAGCQSQIQVCSCQCMARCPWLPTLCLGISSGESGMLHGHGLGWCLAHNSGEKG